MTHLLRKQMMCHLRVQNRWPFDHQKIGVGVFNQKYSFYNRFVLVKTHSKQSKDLNEIVYAFK